MIEKEVRRPAITATIAVGLIGCGLLMLRAFFGWVRRFSRRYEHSGVAVGFGPLYFYFRRRRSRASSSEFLAITRNPCTSIERTKNS